MKGSLEYGLVFWAVAELMVRLEAEGEQRALCGDALHGQELGCLRVEETCDP